MSTFYKCVVVHVEFVDFFCFCNAVMVLVVLGSEVIRTILGLLVAWVNLLVMWLVFCLWWVSINLKWGDSYMVSNIGRIVLLG